MWPKFSKIPPSDHRKSPHGDFRCSMDTDKIDQYIINKLTNWVIDNSDKTLPYSKSKSVSLKKSEYKRSPTRTLQCPNTPETSRPFTRAYWTYLRMGTDFTFDHPDWAVLGSTGVYKVWLSYSYTHALTVSSAHRHRAVRVKNEVKWRIQQNRRLFQDSIPEISIIKRPPPGKSSFGDILLGTKRTIKSGTNDPFVMSRALTFVPAV